MNNRAKPKLVGRFSTMLHPKTADHIQHRIAPDSKIIASKTSKDGWRTRTTITASLKKRWPY